jgi:uncharacterized OsmC-like protein
MKVNLQAIMNFIGEARLQPSLAVKRKEVSGECNFAEGQPHYSATVEFANGQMELKSDQPPFGGGGGTAPDPILYCLFGTASCFAGTMMTIIARRGLKVDSLHVSAENRVNLSLPMGLSHAPIVESFSLRAEYSGEASEVEMNEVVKESLETCPGIYCLKNPIPINAEINRR